MLYTKVRNKRECGINLVTASLGNLYGVTGFSSKKLAVRHVQIVQDNTAYNDGGQNSIQFLLNSFFPPKTEFDIELDLYLVDGRVVELWTKDPSVLKATTPYMTTVDPRAKYREMRSPTNVSTKAQQKAQVKLAEYKHKLGEIDVQMDLIKQQYVSDFGLDIFTDDAAADSVLNKMLGKDKNYQRLAKQAAKLSEAVRTGEATNNTLYWEEY